uniref:Uncharacterized protein n=1 Tax=Meloidogyne enterolobii TaxID=390850 RepID=A0A6V7U2Y7_MELEN|nr:unnamed protein product [Meloidogyne enterolobii]
MNSEVGKEHDKYKKGQSSFDTPLNSKEEHHLQVRVILTNMSIIFLFLTK